MSLTDALRSVADRDTGRALRVFRGGKETERVGFAQLHLEAGQLACGLLERGVGRGERVGLALPTSPDFARAFFGVLAAGAVPVPLPPPIRFAPLEVYAHRIGLAMRQSRVERVLTEGVLAELLGPLLPQEQGRFTVLDVGSCRAGAPEYVPVPEDAPALIQYTSGTSSAPKGVILSHANLRANIDAIVAGLGVTEQDVSGSWLPLFHDMGLIGMFLTPVLNDIETFLQPPEDFLRDPGRWLRIISEHGVTISTAPNSGYLHALHKTGPEQVAEYDLSRWRLALNGAEAVDTALLRRFSAHFAPAGFRPEAFLPVYGLAEGSLAVTFPPVGRAVRTLLVDREALAEGTVAESQEPDGARELASVGVPVDGTELRLVDPSGAPLAAEPAVGSIQIRGASVTSGYEDGSTAGADGWVDTGDLGFRHDGELFVVGRTKEMVIVFGRNYYAADIEALAAGCPGAVPDGVLAAGIPFEDGEGLVVFVETRETAPEARNTLADQVRYAVSSTLGIAPRAVLPVRKGRLPRTSSGKLRRHGYQALYEQYAAPAHPATES
ncbi:fatty acyl-AMP ligase [Kitasatospora sp. NPDC002227]|uniref:fatty acyl-AMP ligase n=1 Tax=Kitasatospora sp. NPDC002227 TaxID=3154773 RepID=UPI0033229B7A